MGPPSGVTKFDPFGGGDIFSSPFLLAQADPRPLDTPLYDRKTAESLDGLSQGCTDSICVKSRVWAGGIYLAQNDPLGARDVYQGMADDASAKNDNEHALLARGLIALQEGRILDAKTLLTPIKSHPYAQTLLKLIDQNDEWVLSLQTLYLLKALYEDEVLKKSGDKNLPRIKAFLDEAEALLKAGEGPELKPVFSKLAGDPTKNFSDLPQILEEMAGGIGGEILRAAGLPRDTLRAQALFVLVNEKLLPSRRSGTAYVVGKIFEKHPEAGRSAQELLLKLNGIKVKNEGIWNDYIAADMLDNGLTSFLVASIALGPGRWASNWAWGRWAARFGPEMGLGRKLLGHGLSLLAGTTAYYLSEKTLLGLLGFDGQILPKSGSEAAREFGADLIVMGTANLFAGGRRWVMKDRLQNGAPDFLLRNRPDRWTQKINPMRWFNPLTTPSQFHWLLYRSASVQNPATKVFEEGFRMRAGWRGILHASAPLVQMKLLHWNHRWQDSSGFMPRFRPGKTTRFPLLRMPESWQDQLLQGYQIQSAERTLGQLLNHLMTARNTTVTDKLYGRIANLKRWVAQLNPGATPEQEEILLGVFWVAQEQGVLGGGAPDILLKWNKEKRYDKLNQYFSKHKIPLEVSSFGDFQLITE